ncbi:Senecionine N-oxygenase [Saxophila tyrrhenica]|uniref:glutaminase n=1 Tax=Saxophila tyrrhenica TaxID=1690608 RepID=A0AAV9PBE9_9PEZI|nr:Senecionine N-oxygenase [Saxophila tyrrhenica]
MHASDTDEAVMTETRQANDGNAVTIGVLALQGAFVEHITLLQKAAEELRLDHQQSNGVPNGSSSSGHTPPPLTIISVRTPLDLSRCSALVIPGGESTAIALIAARTNLLQPLREFVKVQRKPVWGTCAGLILLAEVADRTKSTGQELIGGLDVRVESFEAELELPFLHQGAGDGERRAFHSVFIRAPVVEEVLPANSSIDESAEGASVTAPALKATKADVEILARLPGRAKALKDRVTTAEELGEEGDIVAVRQGNVFATAFHPELTGDGRIHRWWLGEVLGAVDRVGEGR